MAEPIQRRWRIVHSEASTAWGGQEHRILAEMTGFRKRGGEVWLLAPTQSEIFRRASTDHLPCEPITVAPGWLFPVSVVKVAAWLRRVRPHIVNTHSSRDGWLVGLAARLARVPFLVRTRHFDVPIPNRWLSGVVYRQLADHVLTTSAKVTAHFREYFQLPEDRVSTLPTGVDVELFSPRGDVAELLPVAQQKKTPLIGMVSVVRRAKGHLTLLAAARRLRAEGFPAHYAIVGDGPYLEVVRKKAEELQLSDCVTFTGHREDIPSVLRALSVLAIPSLHEGVPQIGLQALAVKTPVVGSDTGGIPTIIRPGETGRLVPPNDPEALAASIRAALTETEITRALAERGRALVEREHSLDTMLDKLDALYRRYLPE